MHCVGPVFMMKALFVILFLASTSASSIKYKNIENEYLLGLDANLVHSGLEEDGLSARLKFDYNMEVIGSYHAGWLTVLHVRADNIDVKRVLELSEVKYVEPNGFAHIMQTSCAEQPSPGTWGLDRIDQRGQLPYTDPQEPTATYTWGERMGSQSVAYVADTGIDLAHSDFEGRAVWGHTAEGIDEPETDLNGHGTHVAGTIGSRSYGVAKSVTLVAVKVMSRYGSGSWSQVLDGLDWILQDHLNRGVTSGSLARSVVNMSIGGSGPNQSLEEFIQEMFNAGVIVAVSAGGSFADACDFTPARTPNATTVASSDISDWITTSNWGTCLDLFAPGIQILSTQPEESTGVFSGTSMATAHVSGVVARYQDSQTPAPTSQQVVDWLASNATPGALTLPPEHADSPNLLLYADC